MTGQGILALLALAMLVVAAVFAAMGWLTDQPDSADRFRWRLLAWLFVITATLLTPISWHPWWRGALRLAWLWWSIMRVQHWYGAWDKARKIERALSQRLRP